MARLSSSLAHHSPATADSVSRRRVAALLLVSLRPEQWTKNLLVFAGVLFGGRLLQPEALWLAVVAFAIFCALSGAVYLLNDVLDRRADERHPLKRLRPIASGQLQPAVAVFAGAALGLVGIGG